MSNPKPIVITRPIGQARPLAQRLTGLGYEVAMFPLLEIEGLQVDSALYAQLQQTLAQLPRFALAVFVSPNAVHSVFAALDQLGLTWPNALALAVVGEGSRVALAEHGINDATHQIYCPTDPFRSDSETLLLELDLPTLKGRDALIFRAESGRELLSDALLEHGINVTKVVAYRRLSPTSDGDDATRLAQQLQGLVFNSSAWVVSSSEALRTLVELTKKLLGDAAVVHLQQVNLLVSHHRIVETAEKCEFKCIRLIGSGDENLLLALQSSP